MKKSAAILLVIITIFLTSCATQGIAIPEMTVTPVPPTTTVIPTPTADPEFIALQEQIAASGERFTLSPDGLFDGAEKVQGVTVSSEGMMTIRVNGELVILDPVKTHFDDETGLSNDEYRQDENGDWLPAKDIITNPSGIGFELGAQVEGQPDGVREVVHIIPFDKLDAKKKTEFETRTDPTTYGFLQGETQLVYIPTEDGKGKVELQRTSNPAEVIAVFGSRYFVWDWSAMLDENGEHVLLRGGRVIERNMIKSLSSARLRMLESVLNDGLLPAGGQLTFSARIIFSKDRKDVVVVEFLQRGDNPQAGFICLIGADNEPIVIYTENFDLSLPYVTR